MDLFLTSFVPKDHEGHISEYEFSQDEILGTCKSCLGMLFNEQNDLFFKEISENYAKIIYSIIGIRWSDDPAK